MKDVCELCLYCDNSVAFGSGFYVNRIPADDGEREGWMCSQCLHEAEELSKECN